MKELESETLQLRAKSLLKKKKPESRGRPCVLPKRTIQNLTP